MGGEAGPTSDLPQVTRGPRRVDRRARDAAGLSAVVLLVLLLLSPPAPPPAALPAFVPTPTATKEVTRVPTPFVDVAERPQPSSRGTGAAAARGVRTVVLDAGHGGRETGATRTLADGSQLREKDATLKVTLAAAEALREAGERVVLTRSGDNQVNEGRDVTGDGRVDVSDDLQARVDLANREGADIFVSIHFNAGGASARGTEVYYDANRPFSTRSCRLAENIYNRLLAGIRATGYDTLGRGVKKDADPASTGGAPLYLLGPQGGTIVRASEMPAALGEGLFVSNPVEAELLRDDSFLQAVGRAYGEGILDYLEGG